MTQVATAPAIRTASASIRELRVAFTHMALGYWRSQVLFTAFKLGIFDLLAGATMTADEVAARCGSAPRHTGHLLEACVTLRLLDERGGRYQNAVIAETFLREGAPHYMGNWIRWMAGCYEAWGHLEETVRSGKPAGALRPDHHDAQESTRSFILAMHDWANVPGSEMANHLDLTGRKRLLDVGGGPGTYAMLLARKHPELHAVVMDLPNVVTIADELIRAWQLTDRVTVRAGDYYTDPLGSGYDVVLISNTLHQEDPEAARAILRKAREALVPGGLLVVHAAFLREGGGRHIWAALQTIQLNLHYEGGRNYSVTETAAMIRDTGFTDPVVKRMSLLNPNSLILATAP